MLNEVSGDILLSKAQVIAHGVAPNDHFNAGLALSLREEWPSMARDFRHYCQSQHPKPGTIWAWAGTDGRRIVNLLTQEGADGHHGANAGPGRIEYIHHALKELRKFVETEGVTSLALPKIGSGAGRLAWGEVLPLIREHLGSLDVPVYVYSTYHAGVQADEKLG